MSIIKGSSLAKSILGLKNPNFFKLSLRELDKVFGLDKNSS